MVTLRILRVVSPSTASTTLRRSSDSQRRPGICWSAIQNSVPRLTEPRLKLFQTSSQGLVPFDHSSLYSGSSADQADHNVKPKSVGSSLWIAMPTLTHWSRLPAPCPGMTFKADWIISATSPGSRSEKSRALRFLIKPPSETPLPEASRISARSHSGASGTAVRSPSKP